MKNSLLGFVDLTKKLNYILNRKQKKESLVTLISGIIASFLDTLGVAAILPFITALTNIEAVKKQWYTQKVIKLFNINNDNELMVYCGVAVVVLYILKNLYLLRYQFRVIQYQNSIRENFATTMLSTYMTRPYSFFKKTNSSILLRGINDDTSAIYYVINAFFSLISLMLTVVMLSIYLYRQDPTMSVGIVTAGLMCAFAYIFILKNKVKSAGILVKECTAAEYKTSYETIEGAKEIYVMQRQNFFVEKFRGVYKKMTDALAVQSKINAIPSRMIETVFVGILIGIVCIKLASGVNPIDYVPQLSLFAVAGFRMIPLTTQIPYCINQMIFYKPLIDDAYTNIRFAREVEKENKKTPRENEEQRMFELEDIRLENIVFSYEDSDEKIINDLSMIIKRGESIGIIGESGAGKSTLSDMIMGLQTPNEGRILVNGINVFDIKKIWAKIIGYIPQSVYVTDDSILNNITFGTEDSDICVERAWGSLEKAQLSEFVKKLPLGINTIIGEHGARLSGGQRQRIAIARALYHDPQILVMDEATSALDNETEAAVMEAINYLQGKKTMIIIAHRLTTVSNCDHIYEIIDGKAKERSKEELYGAK